MGRASFTLTCVGSKRLEFESDEGHRFVFRIRADDRQGKLMVGEASWKDAMPPSDSPCLLTAATSFASVCAEDFGLR